MSKESIEKQNKMFTDWAMMHNDCMDHNPFYFNPNLWFPSWKVMKKLNEIANIDDLASSPLNGHFGEFPIDAQIYQKYYMELVNFVTDQGMDIEIALDKTDSLYKQACAILYEICLSRVQHAEASNDEQSVYMRKIVETSMHETENAFVYKNVNLTWGHVVSMWSCLTFIRKSFDLFSNKSVISILDLGCGAGRLGYLLCKAFPEKISYICCDLPGSSTIAQTYLQEVLPDMDFVTYEDSRKLPSFSRKILEEKPGVMITCAHDISKFENRSVDILLNIYSLGEMMPSTIMMYHEEIYRIANFFYSLNNRYFDYAAGSGFFRDWHIPRHSKHRPEPCTVDPDSIEVKPKLRQWPPWPCPSINVNKIDSSPPWSDLYFEEFHFLPKGSAAPEGCSITSDLLVEEGYTIFKDRGSQIRVPINFNELVVKIEHKLM